MIVGFIGVVAGAPARPKCTARCACSHNYCLVTSGRRCWPRLEASLLRMLQAVFANLKVNQHFIKASMNASVPTWAGYHLNLDYSAKLFVLTFILVVLGSDHASGMTISYVFSF